jgi:hypothetical protein
MELIYASFIYTPIQGQSVMIACKYVGISLSLYIYLFLSHPLTLSLCLHILLYVRILTFRLLVWCYIQTKFDLDSIIVYIVTCIQLNITALPQTVRLKYIM